MTVLLHGKYDSMTFPRFVKSPAVHINSPLENSFIKLSSVAITTISVPCNFDLSWRLLYLTEKPTAEGLDCVYAKGQQTEKVYFTVLQD